MLAAYPRYHGQGQTTAMIGIAWSLAVRFMARTHRWVAERGIAKVRLIVYECNKAAIHFYERLDYRTVRSTMSLGLEVGGG